MKPTTKAELAISGMVELAKLQPAKPLALSVLAEKQSISLSYLEQVFAALRRSGLVLSVRGPGGGYLLSRPANEITAGQIVTAVDSVQKNVPDVNDEAETETTAEPSHVQHFWDFMTTRVIDLYHQVSLQDVMDRNLRLGQEESEMAPQAAE